MDKLSENKGNPLGWAPVVSLMVKFAVPTIISMLVISAYNMTDQIFIGNKVGMLGNAATNVSFPVVMFIMAFTQLCGVGTAANYNLKLGAGDEEKARQEIAAGLSLTEDPRIGKDSSAAATLYVNAATAMKRFGGVSGDLAGWFLVKLEFWLLAALVAVQLWEGVL